MFEWSDTDLIMRDAVREFIAKEIRPQLDALETGELSPYPIARKLFSEFGLDVLAAEAVKTMLDKERARQAETEKRSSAGFGDLGAQASMAAVLVSVPGTDSRTDPLPTLPARGRDKIPASLGRPDSLRPSELLLPSDTQRHSAEGGWGGNLFPPLFRGLGWGNLFPPHFS